MLVNQKQNKIKLVAIGLILILTIRNTYNISLLNNSKKINDIEKEVLTNSRIKIESEPSLKLNSFPKITFNEEIKNFGNVNVNSENTHSFIFTNTGSEPLKIKNAKGSCSCTVPNFSKEPVMPGKQGSIEVTFSPKSSQAGRPQEQTITITSNAEPKTTFLKIKANVNPQ